jgi:hypothetical protein
VFKAEIPRKRTRKPSAKKGGEEGSVGPDLGEAGCQVITILVQPVAVDTLLPSPAEPPALVTFFLSFTRFENTSACDPSLP